MEQSSVSSETCDMIEWENDSELFEKTMSALDDYGQEVAELYKRRLMSDGKVSSGKLVNSIKPLIANTAQGLEYTVYLEMEDYWKYVEKGLRGRNNATSPFPVPSNTNVPAWKRIYPFILEWVRTKPVSASARDGKIPSDNSLAAMISQGIIKNGIKAGGQLEETVREVNSYQLPKLQSALEEDWDNLQYRIYEDINKTIRI